MRSIEPMNAKLKEKDKVSLRVLIMGTLSLILLWIVAVGVMIYGFGAGGRLVGITASVIPYPAASVGGKIITVGKLESQLAAARHFYESQDFSGIGLRVDFSTDQGKERLEVKRKNILNKLIDASIIETEARSRGIRLSDKDVSDQVQAKMAEYGTADAVKADMKRLYDWNISQFEENIVKPDLYRERLSDDIRKNDPENQAAKQKAGQALEELQDGKDFSEVAKKYSEGESAKDGGELGWFTQDQMLPEIAKAVFLMNKGDRSGIIESSLGYHIVSVEDKNGDNGIDKVRLSQVFIRAKGLTEWLGGKEKDVPVRIFIKGMSWDKETGAVAFENGELRDFEANLDRNSPDDASMMF